MNTEQLRTALKSIHVDRGALKNLCEEVGVDYKKIWKFISGRIQKIDLDTASKIIEQGFVNSQSKHGDENNVGPV